MLANIKQGFSLGIGALASSIIISAIAFALLLVGFHLVKQNNKENTKYTEDIQPGQYLGFVLMFIGILPFIRYLIFYFIFNEADNFF